MTLLIAETASNLAVVTESGSSWNKGIDTSAQTADHAPPVETAEFPGSLAHEIH